jgi:hypothetical protein
MAKYEVWGVIQQKGVQQVCREVKCVMNVCGRGEMRHECVRELCQSRSGGSKQMQCV